MNGSIDEKGCSCECDAGYELTDAELVRICEGRAACYAFLSRLYAKEIDEDFLETLKTMRFPAHTGNEAIDRGYGLMAGYLCNLWTNSLTELAVDYARIFIGHGIDAYSAAYPYESVYTSEKRLTMQDARDEVLAIYRSEGFEKNSSWKACEDHIAAELEFMRALNGRTIDAIRREDEDAASALFVTQKNFLKDHLAAWVPMLLSDIRRFAKTDFYLGLAELTEGFLVSELGVLGEVADEDGREDANGAFADGDGFAFDVSEVEA